MQPQEGSPAVHMLLQAAKALQSGQATDSAAVLRAMVRASFVILKSSDASVVRCGIRRDLSFADARAVRGWAAGVCQVDQDLCGHSQQDEKRTAAALFIGSVVPRIAVDLCPYNIATFDSNSGSVRTPGTLTAVLSSFLSRTRPRGNARSNEMSQAAVVLDGLSVVLHGHGQLLRLALESRNRAERNAGLEALCGGVTLAASLSEAAAEEAMHHLHATKQGRTRFEDDIEARVAGSEGSLAMKTALTLPLRNATDVLLVLSEQCMQIRGNFGSSCDATPDSEVVVDEPVSSTDEPQIDGIANDSAPSLEVEQLAAASACLIGTRALAKSVADVLVSRARHVEQQFFSGDHDSWTDATGGSSPIGLRLVLQQPGASRLRALLATARQLVRFVASMQGRIASERLAAGKDAGVLAALLAQGAESAACVGLLDAFELQNGDSSGGDIPLGWIDASLSNRLAAHQALLDAAVALTPDTAATDTSLLHVLRASTTGARLSHSGCDLTVLLLRRFGGGSEAQLGGASASGRTVAGASDAYRKELAVTMLTLVALGRQAPPEASHFIQMALLPKPPGLFRREVAPFGQQSSRQHSTAGVSSHEQQEQEQEQEQDRIKQCLLAIAVAGNTDEADSSVRARVKRAVSVMDAWCADAVGVAGSTVPTGVGSTSSIASSRDDTAGSHDSSIDVIVSILRSAAVLYWAGALSPGRLRLVDEAVMRAGQELLSSRRDLQSSSGDRAAVGAAVEACTQQVGSSGTGQMCNALDEYLAVAAACLQQQLPAEGPVPTLCDVLPLDLPFAQEIARRKGESSARSSHGHEAVGETGLHSHLEAGTEDGWGGLDDSQLGDTDWSMAVPGGNAQDRLAGLEMRVSQQWRSARSPMRLLHLPTRPGAAFGTRGASDGSDVPTPSGDAFWFDQWSERPDRRSLETRSEDLARSPSESGLDSPGLPDDVPSLLEAFIGSASGVRGDSAHDAQDCRAGLHELRNSFVSAWTIQGRVLVDLSLEAELGGAWGEGDEMGSSAALGSVEGGPLIGSNGNSRLSMAQATLDSDVRKHAHARRQGHGAGEEDRARASRIESDMKLDFGTVAGWPGLRVVVRTCPASAGTWVRETSIDGQSKALEQADDPMFGVHVRSFGQDVGAGKSSHPGEREIEVSEKDASEPAMDSQHASGSDLRWVPPRWAAGWQQAIRAAGYDAIVIPIPASHDAAGGEVESGGLRAMKEASRLLLPVARKAELLQQAS